MGFLRRAFPVSYGLLLASSALLAGSETGVVINEIMSRNEATLADADGDFPDWVEILNTGSSSANLAGHVLSDQSRAWVFPPMSLAPQRRLIVFASDKDRAGDELHTDFKIRTGETLSLLDGSGRLIDLVTVPALREDMSYARTPDGGPTWRYLDQPTAGEPNPEQGSIGFLSRPKFSSKGGFYSGELLVELEAPSPASEIRFTLDGSDPSESLADPDTRVYAGAIRVTETTVIAARSFEPGKIPSRTSRETFLLNFENHGLSVLSIAANPDSIHGEVHGLLAPDAPEDYEREVHLTFFEPDGRRGFDLDAGMRLHGRSSRYYPQSSWAIFARDRYGPKEIEYPILPDKEIPSYEAFLVRNNGQDNNSTLIRNAFCSAAVSQLRVDRLAHRAAIVFINGEYQGIQHLSEKINEHYVAANHAGVSPDSLDLMDGFRRAIHGDTENYLTLKRLLENSGSYSVEELYNLIQGHIDLRSYYDYVATQLYFDNRDWTGTNEKLWRPRSAEGRWRWILFDLDGIALQADSMSFRTGGADFFRHFMNVPRIRNEFLVTFCNHLHSTFLEDRVLGFIEDHYVRIRGEMPHHIQRWRNITEDHLQNRHDPLTSVEEWESNVDTLRDFARTRPGSVWSLLAQELGGGEDNPRLQIFVNPAPGGRVDISGLTVIDHGGGPGWNGNYVHGTTVELHALPSEGFVFSHWQLPREEVDRPAITETLLSDRELTAFFLPVEELAAFLRGDANGNGAVDISDAIAVLRFLFLDRTGVRCLDAADTNDDGLLNITDPIHLLTHLFVDAHAVIPPPYPGSGRDRTPDELRCGE